MRTRLLFSLIANAALFVASAARAGSLTGATWTSLIQGVQLTVTNSGATCTDTLTTHGPQSIVCPTAGLGATGAASATAYSVSLTMPLFSVKQFTTGGAINYFTTATLGGSPRFRDQVVSGIDSSAKATMGVVGVVTVKVATHPQQGVNASKLIPRTTLAKIPLSVGVKTPNGAYQPTFTGYFYVLTNTHYITINFYAWTPHTLTFTGLTSDGKPLPDVVAMGSFGLTAGGGGTVTLVSPTKISIDGASPPPQRRTASFTTLKLTYAPEAPTLLLLGAGAAALVLVGSRKRG